MFSCTPKFRVYSSCRRFWGTPGRQECYWVAKFCFLQILNLVFLSGKGMTQPRRHKNLGGDWFAKMALFSAKAWPRKPREPKHSYFEGAIPTPHSSLPHLASECDREICLFLPFFLIWLLRWTTLKVYVSAVKYYFNRLCGQLQLAAYQYTTTTRKLSIIAQNLQDWQSWQLPFPARQHANFLPWSNS